MSEERLRRLLFILVVGATIGVWAALIEVSYKRWQERVKVDVTYQPRSLR